MKDFKKLIAWQKSFELTKKIYAMTSKFPTEEKFGLVSQMNRASVSIVANIAEANGRNTDGEKIQFLGMALGSSFELETEVLLAKELNYLATDIFEEIYSLISEVQRIIIALQKSFKK